MCVRGREGESGASVFLSSLSCILGELFTKRPLFPGYTEMGQLALIRFAELLALVCSWW